MQERISPARRVSGALRLPGDKSISHRYAMLAAIAEGSTRIRNYSDGADCQSTLGAVSALGARIERTDGELVIHGRGLEGLEALHAQAEAARERVNAGRASPLEYWMYARRMDVTLLSQTSGFWQWRVKRHLQPKGFARLSPKQLERYAQALGLSLAALEQLP